jgi:hypothetical protein
LFKPSAFNVGKFFNGNLAITAKDKDKDKDKGT